jgi:hypothetical protein
MQRRAILLERRGITVLGLLLLIIAVIVAAVLLVRYLRTRPAAAMAPPTVTIARDV